MRRFAVSFVIFLSLLQSVSWGTDKAPIFTQKDCARQIMQLYSWSDGLPKDSSDRDYLMILSGRRTFRYEAESAFNEKTDMVTIKEYPLFGAFTGKGWVHGISKPTDSTYTILLPIAGEYDLKAVIKGNGFIWRIDDKEFRADSKSNIFQETAVGRVRLKAGVVTIKLTIPPDGAIDSFSVSAQDFTPVQPLMGWRFKEKLTAVRFAEIVVALKNQYHLLPDSPQSASPGTISVSEKIAVPPTAALTDAAFLGPFVSSKWIRADFRGASLKIPFTVAETGYYGITVNVMGETVSGSVNTTPFKISAREYLSKVTLGVHRLESGDNSITLTMPPTGGFDSVDFRRKSTSPDDFLALAGVPGPAERPVGAEEAEALLKKVQSSFPIRR